MPTHPHILWVLLTLALLASLYYFGTGRFGRSQTQNWIDRFGNHPRLHQLLNRWHGTLRASFHYVEFGSCYLILYLLINTGSLHWHLGKAFLVLILSYLLALLDELHQSATKGRCFRRIDFLHSLLGSTLIMGIIFLFG